MECYLKNAINRKPSKRRKTKEKEKSNDVLETVGVAFNSPGLCGNLFHTTLLLSYPQLLSPMCVQVMWQVLLHLPYESVMMRWLLKNCSVNVSEQR